ncbi:MAG: outer membrane protein assembly factor BamE [Moraxellaceae bacterium]
MRAALIVLLVGLLGGCVTQYGGTITPEQVASIIPGESTRSQVEEILGQPFSETMNSDGTASLLWADIQVDSLTFETKQRLLTVDFDASSKVKDHKLSTINRLNQ